MKTKPGISVWRSFVKASPHSFALSSLLLSGIIFRKPLAELFSLSIHDELATHILIIPVISGLLLYLRKDRIFQSARYCPSIGIPLMALAAVLWFALQGPLSTLNNSDRLSALAALITLVWIAIFIVFYGIASFRSAMFPLLFLFLMSPLPRSASEWLITMLQRGSADVSYALFRFIGVPVIRHGFRFGLPGVEIEVAEQCSGIHAGLSLFIAGLLMEHMLLASYWKKACFTLAIFPIAIFKNALRIVAIAWLGIHVSPAYFYGKLHRQGGLPFSFVALALMAALLWVLRHWPAAAPDPTRMVLSPSTGVQGAQES